MRIVLQVLIWLTGASTFLALYVQEEGWHMRPAPTHWWWYSLSALLVGVNVGVAISEAQHRRARARLLRAMNDLHTGARQ